MKYASAGEGKEQRCFHNGKEGNKKRGRIAGGKCRKAVLRAACAPPIAGEKTSRNKTTAVKRGEIRKQAKALKSSRLWTAGKQVTSE